MTPDAAGFRDFTKGPVGKAILALAIPMVLEMTMESVFSVVDVFFVGKIGATEVATVGLTESLLTLVYCVAMGLSIGAAAVTARRIGESDVNGAAVGTVQSLFLGFIVSTIVAFLGIAFARDLLALMGASADVLTNGTAYCQIMLGGNLAVLMLFLGNAAFRGAGDAWIAMRSLWIANAINVVLCPLLIFGYAGLMNPLGVSGAAIATTTARGVGAIYVLLSMVYGKGRLHIELKHLRPDPLIMASIAKLSASGTFQMFIGMASWVGLVRVISQFGSSAIAGYTIGIRLLVFALLPAYGLGNAAATMVGQSLGAKDPARAEKGVWMAGFYGAAFLAVIGAVFVLIPEPIVGFFSKDPEVLGYAARCLRIIAFGYPCYAYGMIISQAFNGAGDTWTPTWLNFGVFWLLEIPLALLWSLQWGAGPDGVFYSVTAGFSILAVASVIMFRRGGWRLRSV